jgi:mitogen-activated protein kinase 1/3
VYHSQLKLNLKYPQPANILVNEDCSLKICDFGLSRVIGYDRPRGSSSADIAAGLDASGSSTDGASAIAPHESTLPRPLKRQLTRHVVTRCTSYK